MLTGMLRAHDLSAMCCAQCRYTSVPDVLCAVLKCICMDVLHATNYLGSTTPAHDACHHERVIYKSFRG